MVRYATKFILDIQELTEAQKDEVFAIITTGLISKEYSNKVYLSVDNK